MTAQSLDQIKNVDKLKETFLALKAEINKVIVGQDEVIEQILIALLCDGNALLESYPGLGKTTIIKTISEILNLSFSRIQATPDLMPSDITGTFVIEDVGGKKQFAFQKGPIFANIVLADEINRATPKTQSALLEAMQEKQVTVGNKTFQLDRPFFVLATQNPIEQEGTYPLPEAQTDRFLFKVLVGYPSFEEEMEVVERFTTKKPLPKLDVLLSGNSLLWLQQLTREVPIAQDLKRRAVEIVAATRNKKELIEYGASPRASIGLILAAKGKALIDGRKYVSEKDLAAMAFPILRHRIILNFNAERDGKTPEDIIKELVK